MTLPISSKRIPSWLRSIAIVLGVAGLDGFAQGRDISIEKMKAMSLEELLNVQVTTMSRKEELWWAAPGAIDVVTDEEIRRSTAMNLPEVLRLAAGVDVAQPFARGWAVSTRGFNVLAANKISVLMDGRSLFTPFFSGVQWDAQDTLLEDIDRVEVVRGPVGALWGSFAVNGFVQIVTKSADDTQGWLASAGSGTDDPVFVSARYGGRAGERTFYRVYAKYSEMDWTKDAAGRHTQPSVDFGQTGFRVDSFVDDELAVTVQGDAYTNKGLPESRATQHLISGANVLMRVRREMSREESWEVLSYFDHTLREIPSFWKERRNTTALSAKYRRPAGAHDLLFGTDVNVSTDDIADLGLGTMRPRQRTTHTAGAFVQDTWTVWPQRLSLTAGAKLEHNNFSGFEFAPSIRGSWTPSAATTIWAGVSRAVRPPVRVDHDLFLAIGDVTLVEASEAFGAETVRAFELGWRQRWGERWSLDVGAFANDYDDLRTTEPAGADALPVTFKNNLRARSHGLETSLLYQPVARLMFKASHRYLDLDFRQAPGSRDMAQRNTEGNDPRHMFTVTAHIDLPWFWEVDLSVRHVSERPNPASDEFTVGSVRVAWVPSDTFEVALIGRNLFCGPHRELVTTNSLNEYIGPSGAVKATWRY